MKHLIKKLSLNIVAGLVLVTAPVLGSVAHAQGGGTTDFSLSPNSGTYAVGGVLSVQVYEDSGSDPVNETEINLSYSSNLSWDPSSGWSDGTAFTTDAQTTGGSGAVQATRAVSLGGTAVTGKNLIINLYFTVNAGGTATINFNSGTVTRNTTKYDPVTNPTPTTTTYNASTQNGTYNQATSTPPSSGGSSSGSSSGSTSSGTKSSTGSTSKTSTTTKTTTGSSSPAATSAPLATSNTSFGGQSVTISNLAVSDISAYGATVSWTTDVPATSQVNYGTASDQLASSNTDNTLTTTHSIKLTKLNLLSGQTYYYTAKSVDAQGNVAVSNPQSFKTTGAAATTKSNSKTSTWVAVGALVVLRIAILVAGHYIRKIHRQSKELDSHFLNGDPLNPSGPASSGPLTGNGSSQIYAPQNNDLPPNTGTK